jgi:hypothetical protein
MTPEQAAAFVMAQAACAAAEIAGMQAENQIYVKRGQGVLFGKNEFDAIADRYCIGHNAVLTLFQETNR